MTQLITQAASAGPPRVMKLYTNGWAGVYLVDVLLTRIGPGLMPAYTGAHGIGRRD
jgi:hypothetical protein